MDMVWSRVASPTPLFQPVHAREIHHASTPHQGVRPHGVEGVEDKKRGRYRWWKRRPFCEHSHIVPR